MCLIDSNSATVEWEESKSIWAKTLVLAEKKIASQREDPLIFDQRIQKKKVYCKKPRSYFSPKLGSDMPTGTAASAMVLFGSSSMILT